MKSNYKTLGEFIREVDIRNESGKEDNLLGVSIQKEFIPSIANTVGTDFSGYKIVKKGQFAYGPVTSRNGDKISIALLKEDECIVSSSYTVFEIIKHSELLPEYLMLWFRRIEFDRYARFMSIGSVREIFDWDEMCKVELPVPSIQEQQKIVDEYNTVQDRININNTTIKKLEEVAETIYKQRFIDFNFPNKEGEPYKSSGGEMVYCKELEKDIPAIWDCKALYNNPLTNLISTGILKFDGEKRYLATGEVNGNEINYNAKKITHNCRESRANMQPCLNSVWFAKMKNSKKFISLGDYSADIIDNYIFSTGFCGLQCVSGMSLEYINCFINNKDFEDLKDSLSGGTTQEAINTDSLKEIFFPIPDDNTLEAFHLLVYGIYKKIYIHQRQRGKLYELRDLLLSRLYSYSN